MSRPAKPKMNSEGQQELDRAQEKFEKFDSEIKEMTLDRMNQAPREEKEEQTKLSSKEWKEAPEIHLKPTKTMFPSTVPKGPNAGKMLDVFNENFRKEWEYDKQHVRFIAENNEIIGETIEIWTRPYPGVRAELWNVPTNKPVWGPRYLAEQIKRKNYHRLTMDNNVVRESSGMGTITGGIVVDTTIQRLDARSAPKTQISFNRKVSSF